MKLISICRAFLLLALMSLSSQNGGFPEIPPSVLPDAQMASNDGLDPMASRLFRTTATRTQIDLSGFWDFVADPEDRGEASGYAQQFPPVETRLWVPGTWNTLARYWQFQGVGWFHRSFDVPCDTHLRIRFGGVFYRSKVWLDGRLLGEHEGAYTPFAFVALNAKKGRRTLTVRVDSRLNDETLPKAGVDWFPYGGLYRPVYAESVPEIFVENFHVIPTAVTTEESTLLVRVFLKNLQGMPARRDLAFFVDGDLSYSNAHHILEGETVVEFTTPLKRPRLWSPDAPHLYSARVALGPGEDDQATRFGVRSLKTEGNRILLNGRLFKLRGANRHDDHPDWGSALPPHLIRQDVEILKRMGANAVRGHYPPSEMFMDYCDQNGLFFMNEVASWQFRPEQLAGPLIRKKIEAQFSEMVKRDMNHPSVFSWSLGNEWREFHKSFDDIKRLVNYARSVDSTHFITFVTGGADVASANELVDIICTNWAQYQWYEPITYLDQVEGEKSIAKLNEIHLRFPDKPVILTEFGGAESQIGWHSWGNVKWSEEYQARNVNDSARYALTQDWISGGCVWQFCDTRTDPSRMLAGRLRGWNTKGIVDAYRQPKLAFYRLQELFRGLQEYTSSER